MSLIMLNWMWNHIGWEQNVQVIFHPKIKRKKKLCKLNYFWVNCCFKFYMMIRIAHAHMIIISIAQLFNHENVPVPCTSVNVQQVSVVTSTLCFKSSVWASVDERQCCDLLLFCVVPVNFEALIIAMAVVSGVLLLAIAVCCCCCCCKRRRSSRWHNLHKQT